MPVAGDHRAWDAFLQHPDWRYGVEAETGPTDGQALVRRLNLKARDSGIDGVLLVLRSTHATRSFLRAARIELAGAFPVDGDAALERLARGEDPGGSAVIVLPNRRRRPPR